MNVPMECLSSQCENVLETSSLHRDRLPQFEARFAMPREDTMFKWLSNVYGGLVDLLGYVWRATVGKGSVKRWWDSHYK